MKTIVKLSGGRALIATHPSLNLRRQTVPNPGGAPWLVYLPESSPDFYRGSRGELRRLIGPTLGARLNYLAINKPGVGPNGVDEEQFDRSFLRPRRLADARRALTQIIPSSAQIYLVGYSEGAYLAPQIAALDPRVAGIVMIGGGTRGWLTEELNMMDSGLRDKAGRKDILRILKYPRAADRWRGHSYAMWTSFNGDHTLNALRKLRVPTLAILGDRDRAIDLPTTLEDLREIGTRRSVQIELLENCGHDFAGHWGTVGKLLRQFISPLAFP